MYKKLLIISTFLSLLIFSFSVCFANNMVQDAANGVKNVVGGAENAVEGAVKGISNATKDATANFENSANNMTNNMINNNNTNNNHDGTNINTTTGNTGNNYTATRASTTDGTFMGMNSTVWTWLILGVVGIAIIALIWYYSTQVNSSNRYNDRD